MSNALDVRLRLKPEKSGSSPSSSRSRHVSDIIVSGQRGCKGFRD
jgi:hypothetical protein